MHNVYYTYTDVYRHIQTYAHIYTDNILIVINKLSEMKIKL